MNDIYTTDESSLLSQFGLDSSLAMIVPMLIVSTVVVLGLMIFSSIRQHKQRQQSHQMQQDIHAIRELLEKRFGNTTTYISRPAPLNKELESDPQLPPRP
ncbi:MAG TPA: hypothetical protein PKD28_02615 [Candidatus Saccharibacteria bacterium]|nr:hypothetical protein [Candidatus Saccharibacteria bacterium]